MSFIPMAAVWEDFFNNLGKGLTNMYTQIFSIVFIVCALLLLISLLISTFSQDEKKSQTAKAWTKRIAVALVCIVMLFTLINFGYSFLKESGLIDSTLNVGGFGTSSGVSSDTSSAA